MNERYFRKQVSLIIFSAKQRFFKVSLTRFRGISHSFSGISH